MSFFQKLAVRRDLTKVFKSAELFIGSSERPIYPHISRVVLKDGVTEVVFKSPRGLDPKDIEKKTYVFEQVFGDNIELDVDSLYTKLMIYKHSKISNVFDYDVIQKALKGKRLGVVAGIDRHGKLYSYCMSKMPHLLIAGETGSGKSTQLRQILTTLILSYSPKKIKLYLADCKRSEFHIFKNVEHVEGVYSTTRDIKAMLKRVQKEMENRSDLLEEYEVANIEDLPIEHKKPYVVVCIDEFVMLRDDKDIMDILIELVAIGRALGVFAIFSMQRPSAKVIDTTIRANLTVAMGFQLRDVVEERICNTPGASKLKEPGQLILNSDDNYNLVAPYLELEVAKELLKPFVLVKKKNKIEEIEVVKELTESDVFNNVN